MYNDNDEFYLAIKSRKLKHMKLSQLKKNTNIFRKKNQKENWYLSLWEWSIDLDGNNDVRVWRQHTISLRICRQQLMFLTTRHKQHTDNIKPQHHRSLSRTRQKTQRKLYFQQTIDIHNVHLHIDSSLSCESVTEMSVTVSPTFNVING